MTPRYPISHLAMAAAYLLSALLLPWWMTVSFAILLLSVWKSYGVVIFGGLAMDLMFAGGAALPFPYIYGAVFIVLSVLTWLLDRSMLS